MICKFDEYTFNPIMKIFLVKILDNVGASINLWGIKFVTTHSLDKEKALKPPLKPAPAVIVAAFWHQI